MVHFDISSTSMDGQPGDGGIETKASTAQLGLEAGTGAELGKNSQVRYLYKADCRLTTDCRKIKYSGSLGPAEIEFVGLG